MHTPCRTPACTSKLWAQTLLFSSFILTQAHAQFILQPMLQRKTFSPGASKTITFSLENRGEEDQYVRLTVNEIAKDQNNHWVLLDPNASGYAESLKAAVETGPSCRAWATLPKENNKLVLIPPQSKQEVDVLINVPPDANGVFWAGMKCALVPHPDAKVMIRYDFVVPIELTIAEPVDSPPAMYHSITPAVINLEGKPGQTVNTSLSLFRPSDENGDYRTLATVCAIDDSNVKELGLSASLAANPCRSWMAWTTPNQETSFPVEPNRPTQIPIRVAIPKDAWGHYATVLRMMISFGPGSSGGPLQTQYSLFIPVQVNVCETPAKECCSLDSVFIYNEGKYLFQQDSVQGNPFYTYTANEYIHIVTPVPMRMTNSVKATSPAGGRWVCRVSPDLITEDSRVKLSFLTEHLVIENLPNDYSGKIAELEIKLIPQF